MGINLGAFDDLSLGSFGSGGGGGGSSWLSSAGSWLGDNWQGLGQLGLGAYNVYQGKKASDSAADFYDAAGETAEERWNWWKKNMAPLEQARANYEEWQLGQAQPLQQKAYDIQNDVMDYQSGLLPQQFGYAGDVLEAQRELLPYQTQYTKDMYGLGQAQMGALMDSDIWGGDSGLDQETAYIRGLVDYYNDIGYSYGDVQPGKWNEENVRSAILDSGLSLSEHRAKYGDRQEIRQATAPYMTQAGGSRTSGDNYFTAQANLQKNQMGLSNAMIDSAMNDIDQYEKWRPMEDKFYRQSMDGIDEQGEMARAAADVALGHKTAAGATNREMSRLGLDPTSGRYQESLRQNELDLARNLGKARTDARRYADEVNYNRLGTAMNARQRLGAVQPVSTGGMSMPGGGMAGIPQANVPTGTQDYNFASGSMSAPGVGNTFAGLGNAYAGAAGGANQTGSYYLNQGLKRLGRQ